MRLAHSPAPEMLVPGMITRVCLIAVGCGLASVSMLSCNDGSSSKSAATRTVAHEKAPQAMLGTVLPPSMPSSRRKRLDAGRGPFVRKVNLLCERVGRAPLIPRAQRDVARRADNMSEHAGWLAILRRHLLRVHAPAAQADRFRTYLVKLEHEILLDRRIARAARAEDRQAVAIGLSQNEFNRDRRSRIARKLGFSACLRESPSA
jgi:hypothetical protein